MPGVTAPYNFPPVRFPGRLRVGSSDGNLLIHLCDSNTGQLFASCPVDAFPGLAVEPVTDSSRYFVIRLASGAGMAINERREARGEAWDGDGMLEGNGCVFFCMCLYVR